MADQDRSAEAGVSRRTVLRASAAAIGAAFLAPAASWLRSAAAASGLDDAGLPPGTVRAVTQGAGRDWALVTTDAGRPAILARTEGEARWRLRSATRSFASSRTALDMHHDGRRLVAVGHRRRRSVGGQATAADGATVTLATEWVEPMIYTSADGTGWSEAALHLPSGSARGVAVSPYGQTVIVGDLYVERGVTEASGFFTATPDDLGESWSLTTSEAVLSEAWTTGVAWDNDADGFILAMASAFGSGLFQSRDGRSWGSFDAPPVERNEMLYGVAALGTELWTSTVGADGIKLWRRRSGTWSRAEVPEPFQESNAAFPIRPATTGSGVALVGSSRGKAAIKTVGRR